MDLLGRDGVVIAELLVPHGLERLFRALPSDQTHVVDVVLLLADGVLRGTHGLAASERDRKKGSSQGQKQTNTQTQGSI